MNTVVAYPLKTTENPFKQLLPVKAVVHDVKSRGLEVFLIVEEPSDQTACTERRFHTFKEGQAIDKGLLYVGLYEKGGELFYVYEQVFAKRRKTSPKKQP